MKGKEFQLFYCGKLQLADTVKAEKGFQVAEYVTHNVEWIKSIPKSKMALGQ